jgi:hypothetical protein
VGGNYYKLLIIITYGWQFIIAGKQYQNKKTGLWYFQFKQMNTVQIPKYKQQNDLQSNSYKIATLLIIQQQIQKTSL